jgi:hypothetical protein
MIHLGLHTLIIGSHTLKALFSHFASSPCLAFTPLSLPSFDILSMTLGGTPACHSPIYNHPSLGEQVIKFSLTLVFFYRAASISPQRSLKFKKVYSDGILSLIFSLPSLLLLFFLLFPLFPSFSSSHWRILWFIVTASDDGEVEWIIKILEGEVGF